MFTPIRRAWSAVVLVCGAWAVAGSLVACEAEVIPLSPEVIVAKDFTGKAVVESVVGQVIDRHGSSNGPLRLLLGNDSRREQVVVLLSEEITARMRQLGIGNPAEYLRGKVLRVSGTVERVWKRIGPFYEIQVKSLDQIEAIRQP
jgi:hypothetical protein